MALRYWVGGTANWDNTAGTKWSTTDGGAGGSAVPTSADDVFFTATSGANTITITATANAKTLTCTGFTGTLTGSTTLTVAGNVTFVSTMTLNYTGALTITATSNLTSGGKTLGGNLSITSGVSVTLIDNCIILGSLTSAGTPVLLGGKTLTIGTSLTTSALTANNCNLTFNGTGTINNGISSTTACLITINTSGTITIGSGLALSGVTSMTYLAGTVNHSTNTLTISGTGTYNVNGISFYNVSIGGVSTITLGQNLNVINLTTLGTLGQLCTINGNTIYTAGLTKAGTAAIITGTTNIVLNGTGNWTDTTTIAGGYITNNITINTSGIVTIIGTAHRYRTGTITYTSGTVNAGTSKILFEAATTLNTNGMSFYNIEISNTTTITNNSLLTVSNSLTYLLASVVTFAGTSPWYTTNFFILTSNNINHTLVATKEYIVTTYFESIATTSALKDSLVSSVPGTKAIFTLNYGATQNVGYTNATDIDSSRGQTIWTFNGVVTTTFNWNAFTSSSGNQKTYII